MTTSDPKRGPAKEVPLPRLKDADELTEVIPLLRKFLNAPEASREIRNPHAELPVSEDIKRNARPSAVLLPLVVRGDEATVLITKRQSHIRFGGHLCFPGGTVDDADTDAIEAALRESEEEIHLDAECVEVLGSLGDYYTQAGYLIKPVVGLIKPPAFIQANTDEVSEIYEIRLSDVLNSESYKLTWHTRIRGHYAFENVAHVCLSDHIEPDQSKIVFDTKIRVAGPTVSILIGLYESLLAFCRGL